MQIYMSDQTFSVIIFLGNIYSGKLCVFKVFEYMTLEWDRDSFHSYSGLSITKENDNNNKKTNRHHSLHVESCRIGVLIQMLRIL